VGPAFGEMSLSVPFSVRLGAHRQGKGAHECLARTLLFHLRVIRVYERRLSADAQEPIPLKDLAHESENPSTPEKAVDLETRGEQTRQRTVMA
jgi:hypothetical protein